MFDFGYDKKYKLKCSLCVCLWTLSLATTEQISLQSSVMIAEAGFWVETYYNKAKPAELKRKLILFTNEEISNAYHW